MVGVFLRYQPRDTRDRISLASGIGVDEPVRELGLDPLVLVAPDDEGRRLDDAEFVFVQIALVTESWRGYGSFAPSFPTNGARYRAISFIGMCSCWRRFP